MGVGSCPYRSLDCKDSIRDKSTVTWKPSLWFVKGHTLRTTDFINDSVVSQTPAKELHAWEQSITEANYVISKLTFQGDVVLDCFMGIGTTGIAAFNQNRQFIGIEKDTKVLQIAKAQIGTLFPHIKH